jgi:hypothetical protein
MHMATTFDARIHISHAIPPFNNCLQTNDYRKSHR